MSENNIETCIELMNEREKIIQVKNKTKNQDLNRNIEQFYDVYFKKMTGLFPHYKKDRSLSGKSLDTINMFMREVQNRTRVADPYSVLEGVKEEKGSLIYKFRDISAHPARITTPDTFTYYKIISKLKLEK